MRIRNPTSVTVGGTAVTGVKSVQWDQGDEYDRSQGDDELSGDPVLMKEAGSGTIELLGGAIPSCYGQDIVVKYNEITVAAGAESETEKTVTFGKCTINPGGNVPSGGAGGRSIKFDFGGVTEA